MRHRKTQWDAGRAPLLGPLSPSHSSRSIAGKSRWRRPEGSTGPAGSSIPDPYGPSEGSPRTQTVPAARYTDLWRFLPVARETTGLREANLPRQTAPAAEGSSGTQWRPCTMTAELMWLPRRPGVTPAPSCRAGRCGGESAGAARLLGSARSWGTTFNWSEFSPCWRKSENEIKRLHICLWLEWVWCISRWHCHSFLSTVLIVSNWKRDLGNTLFCFYFYVTKVWLSGPGRCLHLWLFLFQ